VLVDGFARANWHFDREGGTLRIEPYDGEPLDAGEEADAFAAFLRTSA
jgi:hypothetical protein